MAKTNQTPEEAAAEQAYADTQPQPEPTEPAATAEVQAEDHPVPRAKGEPAAAVAELTADLQRLQAEFANYRRRSELERTDIVAFAKNRAVREFLAVRDSFDSELAHRPAAVDAEWAKSIDSIRAQFDAVLASFGVERFEAKGQPFDPHLHEAVATDGDGDTVTEELQAGYKSGDTIIRHAIVKVG